MPIRLAAFVTWVLAPLGLGQGFKGIPTDPLPGDRMLAEYFEAETAKLEAACLAEITTAGDWEVSKDRRRADLQEMLGMQMLPPRGDLKAEVTGSQAYEDIVVENVVFQSLPGLYVTANFYAPVDTGGGALPTILYVCGHSRQKEGGVSFGNKTGYHHHGVWFAKNGYACLMIDTIQLGEIEGLHHGTYHEGRWWWNARGYTPAGVEAWNGMRAIDYLATRPECDVQKLGVTGRSGGGAYSWWIAALDERVKVAVPVAGITSLRNHVVDGCVEGHCDCMFHINTYRWDFPAIAALVAPRPLLIANTDGDRIFPLDGVVDVHAKTKRIYDLLGAGNKIGLAIVEGPHKDTQPLRSPAFHWFERHLKGKGLEDELDTRSPKGLDRKTLRVLKKQPADEIVTTIDESFVPKSRPPVIDKPNWGKTSEFYRSLIRRKCFAAWPDAEAPVSARTDGVGGGGVMRYELETGDGFHLSACVAATREGREKGVVLIPVHQAGWEHWTENDFERLRARAGERPEVVVVVGVRGVAGSAWTSDRKERVQIRRRFMLLGTTLDAMRVWDIRRSIAWARSLEPELALSVEAEGAMAQNALYALLFEEEVASLELHDLPTTHRGARRI